MEPFLGEIRMIGFSFNPRGWAKCDGGMLSINQNQALFMLLGDRYGGDGRTTFALPDLRGRTPISMGQLTPIAYASGEEFHLLKAAEQAAHTHGVVASSDSATTNDPNGKAWALYEGSKGAPYGQAANLEAMATETLTPNGDNGVHYNMMPYTVLNFCIAIDGMFPSRS